MRSVNAFTIGMSCGPTFSVLPVAPSWLNDCLVAAEAPTGDRTAVVALPYLSVSSLLPTLLTNPSFLCDAMSTDGFEMRDELSDVAAASGFTPVPCGIAGVGALGIPKPMSGCRGAPPPNAGDGMPPPVDGGPEKPPGRPLVDGGPEKPGPGWPGNGAATGGGCGRPYPGCCGGCPGYAGCDGAPGYGVGWAFPYPIGGC